MGKSEERGSSNRERGRKRRERESSETERGQKENRKEDRGTLREKEMWLIILHEKMSMERNVCSVSFSVHRTGWN